MNEYIWIDVIEVGRKIGVPEQTFIPPIPGETRSVTVQDWNGQFLWRAISLIAPYKEKGGTIVLTGHVDAWIILGLANSLKPECKVMFGAGLEGPGALPTPTEILELRIGDKNPELRFDFDMRIKSDCCYMDYQVDDPDAPVGVVHTFPNDKLPELVLPPIPENKHLFLYAKACYYVQVNVTNSYFKQALSVSTAYHDVPEYHCAFSISPEIKVGDATPRYPSKLISAN